MTQNASFILYLYVLYSQKYESQILCYRITSRHSTDIVRIRGPVLRTLVMGETFAKPSIMVLSITKLDGHSILLNSSSSMELSTVRGDCGGVSKGIGKLATLILLHRNFSSSSSVSILSSSSSLEEWISEESSRTRNCLGKGWMISSSASVQRVISGIAHATSDAGADKRDFFAGPSSRPASWLRVDSALEDSTRFCLGICHLSSTLAPLAPTKAYSSFASSWSSKDDDWQQLSSMIGAVEVIPDPISNDSSTPSPIGKSKGDVLASSSESIDSTSPSLLSLSLSWLLPLLGETSPSAFDREENPLVESSCDTDRFLWFKKTSEQRQNLWVGFLDSIQCSLAVLSTWHDLHFWARSIGTFIAFIGIFSVNCCDKHDRSGATKSKSFGLQNLTADSHKFDQLYDSIFI